MHLSSATLFGMAHAMWLGNLKLNPGSMMQAITLRLPKKVSSGQPASHPADGRLFDREMRFSTKMNCLFLLFLATILAVSTYDTYLVVLHHRHIQSMERNPICLALIQMDPGSMSYFLLGKLIGNLFVVATLSLLKSFGFRHILSIAASVAIFQVGLLCFLEFSDPLTGFLHLDGLFSRYPYVFNLTVTHPGNYLFLVIAASTWLTATTWINRQRPRVLSR